jgi:hypothetical protein
MATLLTIERHLNSQYGSVKPSVYSNISPRRRTLVV